jgi:hypothetical protein
MNESTIRRELYQMLRYRYNLWPDHFPDIKGVKEPGRPDLVVMNPKGPGYYVEVKALNVGKATAFPFSSIYASQKRWLDAWEEVCPGHAWLGIGVCGIKEREMYLLPWPAWWAIEEEVSIYQASLPYVVGDGYLTEMQELGLDFRLLQLYRLERVPKKERLTGESGWKLPPHLEYLWTS